MKRIAYLAFTTLSVCLAGKFSAQLTTISAAPGSYLTARAEQSQDREEVIWTETFANGIPAGWVNEDAGGVALWEYRGPATTPNNEVGTIGSCIPEGAPGGAPILSPTWSDGFVIFDSNFWDNPDNPCSPQYFGTGPAPAPHLAVLETPSMDFTGYENLGVIFHQYIKHYQCTSSVQVSVNGGNWVTVFENDLLINQATDLDDMQRVVISPLADNQSDVRIRFVFEGTYYFWMIDDVQVVVLDENNMSARYSTYGDFDFYDPAHDTGYEYMEYDQYPVGLEPQLKFTTMADNFGSQAQTDVRLAVEIVNTGNQNTIHNGLSNEGFTVQPGNDIELRAGDFQMSAAIAQYDVIFSVVQEEEEQAPEDNNDTLHFEISSVTYARDRGFTDGIFVSTEDYNDQAHEIGNVFLIEESGFSAHSVSACVAVGTSLPVDIYASIYSFAVDTVISYELIGTTSMSEVLPEHLNDFGQENLITLSFDQPVDLAPGAYLVVIGTDAGPDEFYVATSGDAYELSSWVWYGEDELFYIAKTPMVRLNVGPFVSVEETSISSFLSVYPNPASEQINIDIPSGSPVQCALYNASGMMLEQFALQPGTRNLDLRHLAGGTYWIKAISETETSIARFVKQ